MSRTTRMFRIFVSSTFSDLKEERNALQKYVFPRLRELCLQHGCRFQAIDLRWGVRDEAGLDQQTMKICLDEVSRSQRASPRPNFIVLLGDRYGWRPLPAEIPAREFTHIHAATPSAADREFVDAWYRRDANACHRRHAGAAPEAVYCLQPRTDRFADFHTWEREVERPLRAILLRGLAGLDLTDDERRKYEASATEQEIAAGALKVPDASEHVSCFLRTIDRLPADESARDFGDLDEHGHVDREAVAKLTRLKGAGTNGAREAGFESGLPGNIHRYRADWVGSGITTAHIGTLPERLEDCLSLLEAGSAGAPPDPSVLCVDVWRRLARVILDEIARLERADLLEQEIAAHVAFAEDRARSFVGRRSMLETIANYLQGADRHPLAVWGESGSGKSALMAKAVADCRSRSVDGSVVSRFIGATPASSDGRSLLESLCRQVTRLYEGDEASIPSDYRELVHVFGERLKLAAASRPLILMLDALDQLSDADHARNLIWLPAQLPEHVRLVVSTLPGECKTALDRTLPSASVVKLEPMPRDEAADLLEAWLMEAGRTLQPPQRDEVLTKFAHSARTTEEEGAEQQDRGMPLYLKLAFEEARRWKSYTPPVALASTIPGIVRQLFGRLQSDIYHGETVVSRSLGYLASARNGLSEDEILDVLSLDEDVRADFKARAKHTPPEERLPVIVWSRLYFDLEPYLTECSADGAVLLSFYHRQLREVVEETFLEGDERGARHSGLAEYFASQELFEKESTPNTRKLSELPYQQTHAALWESLHATLTDFEFVEAKCTYSGVISSSRGEGAPTTYGGVYELLEDYRRAHEAMAAAAGRSPAEQHADIDRFGRLVGQCAFIFKQVPGLVFQELHNRLAGAARGRDDLDRRLARARARHQSPWLRLRSGDIDIPELLHILSGHATAVLDCAFSADGSRLASAGSDGTLRVWSADTGEQTACFRRPGLMFWRCAFAPNGESIAAMVGTDYDPQRTLVLLDVESQSVRDVGGVAATTLEVCPFNPAGGTFLAPDARFALCVVDARSGELVRTLTGHSAPVLACAFSADGTRAASVAADGRLIVWDVRAGRELRSGLCLCRTATTAALSPALDLVAVAFPTGHMLLWDAEAARPRGTAKGHEERLMTCRFSADGSLILTHDSHMNAAIWDAATLRKIAAVQGGSGSLNAQGDRLVTAGCPPDYSAHVWNTQNGVETARLTAHTFEMEACAFSPNGRRIATAACDGTLMLWDAEAAERRGPVDGPRASGMHIARFSPGSAVAAFASREIALLDRESGREVGRLAGHPQDTYGLSFSPDGRLLASTGMAEGLNASLIVWDVASGRPTWSRTAHTWTYGCRFSPDGRHIVWEHDYREIVVVDAVAGAEVLRLEERVLGARESAFHPDGRLALLNRNERTLDLWDLDRGHRQTLVEGLDDSDTWSFSPDGGWVAVADGETLFVCDVTTGERLTSVPDRGQSCRFSPDGRRILTVELHDAADGEQLFSIRLRQATRLELLKTIRFTNEMEGLVDGAFGFSPDGRRGYWASDERILLFEIGTAGQLLFRHKAGGMRTFDMSPDGLWIASGNARGDAFLFSLENIPAPLDGS